MFLDFISNLPTANLRKQLAETQEALSQRQVKKIAQLRADGFHALARWFSENPASIG